jgi:hypothetical protein
MGNINFDLITNAKCLKGKPCNNRHFPADYLGIILLAVILFVGSSACQPVQKTIESTPKVEETQLPPTEVIPSSTPKPTSTITPATQQVQGTEPTQADVKATQDASANMTATVIAPILKELPSYSVDPARGSIAAIYEPITLTADGFHASQSTSGVGALSEKDFLIAADITWDSEYGNAGCGFTFRSNGSPDTPSEYRVVLSRISGGRINFYTLANGKIANFRDFYAIPYDRYFKWENGTTNRLAVGVKGNVVYIFSNKTWVGVLDITTPPPKEPVLPEKPEKPAPPPSDLTGKDKQEAQKAYRLAMEEYQEVYEKYTEEISKVYADYNAIISAYSLNNTVYDEGTVGMLAYSTSGKVNCHFTNAWLWVFK